MGKTQMINDMVSYWVSERHGTPLVLDPHLMSGGFNSTGTAENRTALLFEAVAHSRSQKLSVAMRERFLSWRDDPILSDLVDANENEGDFKNALALVRNEIARVGAGPDLLIVDEAMMFINQNDGYLPHGAESLPQQREGNTVFLVPVLPEPSKTSKARNSLRSVELSFRNVTATLAMIHETKSSLREYFGRLTQGRDIDVLDEALDAILESTEGHQKSIISILQQIPLRARIIDREVIRHAIIDANTYSESESIGGTQNSLFRPIAQTPGEPVRSPWLPEHRLPRIRRWGSLGIHREYNINGRDWHPPELDSIFPEDNKNQRNFRQQEQNSDPTWVRLSPHASDYYAWFFPRVERAKHPERIVIERLYSEDFSEFFAFLGSRLNTEETSQIALDLTRISMGKEVPGTLFDAFQRQDAATVFRLIQAERLRTNSSARPLNIIVDLRYVTQGISIPDWFRTLVQQHDFPITIFSRDLPDMNGPLEVAIGQRTVRQISWDDRSLASLRAYIRESLKGRGVEMEDAAIQSLHLYTAGDPELVMRILTHLPPELTVIDADQIEETVRGIR